VSTVTDLIEVPLDAYRTRAANVPEPAGHRQLAARLIAQEAINDHDPDMAWYLATDGGINYFADISEYQHPFDSTYAYPIGMFRFFSGYRTDYNARANWAQQEAALSSGKGRISLAYPVFIPGQLGSMLASLKNTFGSTCPTNRLVIVPDMESGPGFAGPGDHSVEANDWVYALADYTGTPADLIRAHAYANNGDFASCWPQIDDRVKKHTAAYNAVNPGTFAWQYQGGNPAYPAPAGAPRAYAPFGTYVDGNVIYQTLDQIEQLLGITPTLATGDDMSFRVIYCPSEPTRAALGVWAVGPGIRLHVPTTEWEPYYLNLPECANAGTAGPEGVLGTKLPQAVAAQDWDLYFWLSGGDPINPTPTNAPAAITATLTNAQISALASQVAAAIPPAATPPSLTDITAAFTKAASSLTVTSTATIGVKTP
jgi:hypothetical protein